MASDLDLDVVTDCCVDETDNDLDVSDSSRWGSYSSPSQPAAGPNTPHLGVAMRVPKQTSSRFSSPPRKPWKENYTSSITPSSNVNNLIAPSVHTVGGKSQVYVTQDISDNLIEDGAHVVFDWDNTLKLYDKKTQQLSSRVSREFLLHLKKDRGCRLYIISAIRPSPLNLGTLLSEVDKLGLTDIFVNDVDDVDGGHVAEQRVSYAEYAQKGGVIICGYDKAEAFLKLSSYDASKGDRVMFFDDEFVNIQNFHALVPNSACYLCE